MPMQVLMVTWDVLAGHEAMRAWHAARLSAHAADLAGLRAARARLHARLMPNPNPCPATQPGGAAAADAVPEGGDCQEPHAADRMEADGTAQVFIHQAGSKQHAERTGALAGAAALQSEPAGPGLCRMEQAKLAPRPPGSPASRMVDTIMQHHVRPLHPARAGHASTPASHVAAARAWQPAVQGPGLHATGAAAAAGHEALAAGPAGVPGAGAPAESNSHKDALQELQVHIGTQLTSHDTEHGADKVVEMVLEDARNELAHTKLLHTALI